MPETAPNVPVPKTAQAEMPSTSDLISLRGITARGRHGVLDWEQAYGQPFVVDADLSVDIRRAAVTDDLALTVNYAEVAAHIVALITGEPFALIETLAERIAADVLGFNGVSAVTVTVHKPEAPVGVPFTDVAVVITRHGGDLR